MKKLTTNFILLILSLVLVNTVVAQQVLPLPEQLQPSLSEPHLLLPGRLEGTGTHFELKDSNYLNITLDSTEPIKLTLESVPEMVSLHVEPISGATSTQITLSGFFPSTTYYKYEDSYHNLVSFTTDSSGRYTYTQDLSKPHLIFIQPQASTIFLTDDGWSNPIVGSWDSTTRIAILNTDLYQTIQIDTNNITLDGNGHTLTGGAIGVYLQGRTDVTIKNLKVREFTYGIYLTDSNSNIILGNTIDLSLEDGIYLYFSDNNTFINNRITNARWGAGMRFFKTSNNNKIINNTFDSNYGCGIFFISSNNNNILDNIVTNSIYGIYLPWSNNNILSGNTISAKEGGIYLYYSSNNNLSDNTVSNNKYYGITLYSSNNNNLIDNYIDSNAEGIVLTFSNNNNLIANTAESNSNIGISLGVSYGNNLRNNIIRNNPIGVGVGEDSIFNTFSANLISNNLDTGIYLRSGDNNTFSGNTIDSNGRYGIWLFRSSENKVYNNNFLNNPTQAYVFGGSGNVFNLNKPLGGNYWSSWTSPDSDADGFVDNPYVFIGGQDNLPWTQQNGWFAVTVVAPSILSEKSSSYSTLTETLLSQKANLSDVAVSGDFESTLNFTDLEMITITTGPFAGKGFSKGQCETTLEGVPYRGNWQGILFLKPQEKRIYLKGSITGGILATVEGYLTESTPESGIYDQYEATWKIGRLGDTITSATINLKGTLTYQESSEYPLTELYLLQVNIEGDISGRYAGSLNTVLTHLRVISEDNPYFGEGFSIISYTSESGSGEGWTCDKTIGVGKVELKGMFTSPLFGILSAILDETKLPRTLSLTVEGIDLGLPPAPDLKVRVWGPQRVSPGQTIDYIIEYRNDGLKAAEETLLFVALDDSLKYISASEGSFHNDILHTVSWNLGNLPAKSSGYLSIQAEVAWGLPEGATLETDAIINELMPHSDKKGIFVNGIGLYKEDKRDEDYARICENFASNKDLEWVEAYNTGSGVEDVGEVINADNGIATKYNGLKDDRLINKEYDSAAGYSGGTKTIVTAIKMYGLKVKELVLISPVMITTSELETLRSVYGVEKIIIYQSEKDKLPWGGLYQLKIPKDDPLRNEPWLEVRDRDDAIHKFWLQTLLNEDNKSKENMSSTNPHIITTARDPNEKFVSPEGDVRPNERLDYTIKYENEGKGVAYGVYIADTLDEDLDDKTLEIGPVIDVKTGLKIAPPGTYDPQTRTITWFVGEVGSGQGGYTEFSTNIRNDAPDDTEIINFATVYFPSVPEETQTNGTVNRVSTDNIAPITTAVVSPSPNPAGWNNTDVTVSLTATDNEGGAGVKKIHYTLTKVDTEGATISSDNIQIPISSEGISTLTYWAVDNVSNVESAKTLTVKIDKAPPTVIITTNPNTLWPPNHKMVNVTISGEANDTLSGIASTKFSVEDEYNTIEPAISEFGDIIQLEAWREGDDKDGRIYTIFVTTKDKAANQTSSSTTVLCPHDQRKK